MSYSKRGRKRSERNFLLADLEEFRCFRVLQILGNFSDNGIVWRRDKTSEEVASWGAEGGWTQAQHCADFQFVANAQT